MSIVTGGSRGLGQAVVAQLLARGHRVLAIARRAATAPPGTPAGQLLSWQHDLSDSAPLAERLHTWLHEQGAAAFSSVTLINNAATVSRLAPLGHVEAADLAQSLRVGLEAPLLLGSAFLRATEGWPVPRRLLFVSSGLGRRAMAGAASYCAVKAGMDHLARAVALEEAARPNGARVVSLAPGIIDTDMQLQLRSADPALFAERDRFAGFKSAGQLDSPEAAAAKLVAYLERADFGSNPIGDVRDPA